MIPYFSIVSNRSNSGKTYLLCKLVRELKKRGYRVATIKHASHHFDFDFEGKDSKKHCEAGSDITVLSSSTQFVKLENFYEEKNLEDIVREITDVDIVIAEGYKHNRNPKIEVYRESIGGKLVSKEEDLIAIVSDKKFKNKIKQYEFSEIEEITDVVERMFFTDKKLMCI